MLTETVGKKNALFQGMEGVCCKTAKQDRSKGKKKEGNFGTGGVE